MDAVVARAIKAGAKLIQPVENRFYGDRSGSFVDPFGHHWNIATHIETQTAELPRSWRPLVYCWRGGQRSAVLDGLVGAGLEDGPGVCAGLGCEAGHVGRDVGGAHLVRVRRRDRAPQGRRVARASFLSCYRSRRGKERGRR